MRRRSQHRRLLATDVDMPRFFSRSLMALALLVGVAGAAPAAYAELLPEGMACPQSSYWIEENNQCEYGDGSPVALVTEDEAVAQETVAAETRIANDQAAGKTVVDYEAGKMDEAYSQIMIQIMRLFAWLVGVAVLTLNYAVDFTVVTMGSYIKDLSAVGVTWRILRDIGNIMLIFGFLAAGIMTILNVDWYGFGKKMLPKLLIAAVFLNFSLFISYAIIDTGNLFATQFYTQISGGTLPTAATVGTEGISDRIMSQVGLQTIYGQVKQGAKAEQIFKSGTNPWIIGFMAVLLFIILAFVLFSLAFVLIARFVIIVSPVGFAGLAIPKLSGLANKWWSMLAEQTLTAPVLLLLLYIALAVITDVKFLTGFTSGAGTPDWLGYIGVGNLAGFASILLSFLVAMGLLLAVIIFAKQLSAFGAGWAIKMGSKLSGVSIAAATPGWVGRYTVGLGANYAARKLRGTAFGRSFIGRGFADTLEKKVAGASFDVRNTALGKSASGIGLDLGKGQTGGYRADLEERVKSYERAAAGIEGRKRTKEEEAGLTLAAAGQKAAEDKKAVAQTEYDTAVIEHTKQKAEVDRLVVLDKSNRDKGIFDPKTSADLKNVQNKLVTSEATLTAANTKLAQAETEQAARTGEATKLRGEIDYATSKKGAQETYAESLKEWGKYPIFGTAAAAAAGRVKSSAGKTKNQLAIEAFMVKAQEAATAGGTTIPAATATATATPPPAGGGTPKP